MQAPLLINTMDPQSTSKIPVVGLQRLLNASAPHCYSTGFKKIEKINATASQPQRPFLKFFAIFKNSTTRRLTRLQTMYNVLKYRKT